MPALSTSSNSRSARLTLVLPRLMALSVAEMPSSRLANLPPAVATSQESYPRRPGPCSCPGSGIISGSRPRPRLLSRPATSAPVPSPVPVPSPIHVPIPTLAPVPPPSGLLWLPMAYGRCFAEEDLRTKICGRRFATTNIWLYKGYKVRKFARRNFANTNKWGTKKCADESRER